MNEAIECPEPRPEDSFLIAQAAALPALGKYAVPDSASCSLAAQTDIDAVLTWLQDRAKSAHTRDSYFREVSRLYMWSARYTGKPLSGLAREDFLAFQEFLANVPTAMKGPAVPRFKNGKPNPSWRPFVLVFDIVEENNKVLHVERQLSSSSIQQSLRVIMALFRYWHEQGYIAINPLKRSISAKDEEDSAEMDATKTERYLEPETWEYLINSIDRLPQGTIRDKQHYERARWIFTLAYETGARLDEMKKARMGDFIQRMKLWWLVLLGKGNKRRRVPVSDALLEALKRYRRSMFLPDLPQEKERRFAIMSVTGRSGVSRKTIYLVIKEVCGRAIEDAPAEMQPALREVSPHWLRHTIASHMVNSGVNVRAVQQHLGHVDITTTMKYMHSDAKEFHRAITKPKRNHDD